MGEVPEEIPRVLFFDGEEEYRKEEEIRRLREKLLKKNREFFNFSSFFLPEDSVEEIINSASLTPLGEGRRLVVVRGVEKALPPQQKRLLAWLSKPAPETCLILTGFFDKEELRRKKGLRRFYEELKRKSAVKFFPLLSRRELFKWIKKRVAREKKLIEQEACEELVERAGRGLTFLSQELEKLILYVHPRTQIRREDVIFVGGESPGVNTYTLQELIRKRDLSQAVLILNKLLERGERPLKILDLTHRELRILLLIKERKNISSPKTSPFPEREKVPSWLKKKYLEAEGNFSLSELVQAERKLLETDLLLKSTASPPRSILERLLIQILRKEK